MQGRLALELVSDQTPALMIVGVSVFGVGCLAGIHVISKAKGRRSLLPFIRGRSRIHAYWRGVQRHGWPRYPLILWLLCLPAGAVMILIASLMHLRDGLF